jgi:hypothetical protein
MVGGQSAKNSDGMEGSFMNRSFGGTQRRRQKLLEKSRDHQIFSTKDRRERSSIASHYVSAGVGVQHQKLNMSNVMNQTHQEVNGSVGGLLQNALSLGQ